MKAETAQAGIKKRSSPDTAAETSNKPVKAASTSGEAVAVASVKRDDAIAVPVFGLDPPGPNGQYLSNVMKDMAIITEKWPTICKLAPLPLTGTDGHLSLTGYGAPFDCDAYDSHYLEDKFEYSCFFNFMAQDMYSSILPYVPLYWERVLDYVDSQVTEPGMFRHVTTLLASSVKGEDILKGGLTRLSPCEPCHDILHAVAMRIAAHADDHVLKQWLRALLSAPCVLKKKKTKDEQFAEANSLRQDADSVAKTVVFSARQMIHTIGNFKDRKEADLKKPFGAKLIAAFWRDHVRGESPLQSHTVVDSCLTVRDRMFNIPGVETIIVWGDKKYGRDSVWNSLNKLQEVVYRCGKSFKIAWFMRRIQDNLQSGKIANGEITLAAIKTGSRSMSDVALYALDMKKFLLNDWLDSQQYPSYVKEKARTVFETHDSWRLLWHPLGVFKKASIKLQNQNISKKQKKQKNTKTYKPRKNSKFKKCLENKNKTKEEKKQNV